MHFQLYQDRVICELLSSNIIPRSAQPFVQNSPFINMTFLVILDTNCRGYIILCLHELLVIRCATVNIFTVSFGRSYKPNALDICNHGPTHGRIQGGGGGTGGPDPPPPPPPAIARLLIFAMLKFSVRPLLGIWIPVTEKIFWIRACHPRGIAETIPAKAPG